MAHGVHGFGTASAQTIIRMPEVEARTGLGKSEIYRRIRRKDFPRDSSR
jgi:predicted DNA-binding transcriptional regulator AlpA